MSDKKGEKSKQSRRSQEEKKNGQEDVEESEECTYSDEVMRSFLSDEDNKPVREAYQNLMTVINQHADEQSSIDTHTLQLVVLQANEAFVSVKRPREGAIDAHLLKQCGRLAKHNLETSQSSLAVFKSREFAEKLIELAATVEDDPENDEEHSLLSKIGKNSSYLFSHVCGLQPFFSALDWEKPPPQQRAKPRKKDCEDAVKREVQKVAVLRDDEGEEEATAVSWMCKILKQCYVDGGNMPLPFFKFIVNPTSFSRTVENLFHISLLVREQYAEIIEDGDGLPVILPTQTTGTGTQQEDKQCILPMDEREWRELIKTFDITHAMIPPKRPQSKKRK